ncbi:hypothetical protein HY643_01605 [Candidatus Woesearchaeota archaeon]|nr:hypothetical protein [Candidatus Woesearchaeota archaeon]
MGLRDIFKKAEKPLEEKKLEAITTDESVIDEWNVKLQSSFCSMLRDWKDDFKAYVDYSKSFKIKPDLITKFNESLGMGAGWNRGTHRGLFLSALIQTSYDQGSNNFEFEEISANLFGGWLEGKESNTLKIRVKKISGHFQFWESNYTYLIAENFVGDWGLFQSTYSTAKIISYDGQNFGIGMQHNTIVALNQNILERLRAHCNQTNNTFTKTKG